MKNKGIKFIFLLLVLSIIGFYFFGNYFKKEEKYEDSKFLFGTYIKITMYSKDKALANRTIEKAFSEIERIDKKFNSKSKGSLIYNLNNSDNKNLVLDDESREIFNEVKKVYELSSKKYDITISPLLKLWGFSEHDMEDSNKKIDIPTKEKIKEAQKNINFEEIKFKEDKLILKDGIEIDTGSFLKGYAISKAGEVIKKEGISKVFITAISSLNTIGTKPENKKWRIGLQNPQNPQELLGIVTLADKSMGVSGDYQTYVEIDGKLYHHILDKETGYPVEDKKMVAVITENTFLADLYSTAFFLMPINKVIGFVEQKKDLEVLIVDKNMNIIKSNGFVFEKIRK